jgi:hypothetical protein
MREVTAEENMKRSNYRIADNIDYLDGDLKSSIFHILEILKIKVKLTNQ